MVLFETDTFILDCIARARAERGVALGGAPDLLERYQAQARLGDEVSPHFSLVPMPGSNGEPSVQVVPKNPALGEAAMSISAQVAFRAGDPEHERRRREFEEAMCFGGEVVLPAENVAKVVITAPPELGLSEEFTSGVLRITAHREELGPGAEHDVLVLGARVVGG